MGEIFLKTLNTGLTAGWLILAVIVFRLLFRRAPKWISCLLWGLVAFKLACPVTMESALSLIPSSEPLPEKIMTENSFRVDTGIGFVDAPMNAYLGDHYYEGVTVPADSGSHVMNILGTIWITGVIIMLLYSFVSYYRLYRITGASVRLRENIFRCDLIDTPFILGIVRPRICLPSGMEGEQMEYVVAHERAHLERRDHWWKPAGFLLLSVYWFQPLCWAAYILLCRDIELACDEKVIRTLGGESKKAYAEALLSCSVRHSAVAACPLAFGEVGVKERIKNVLHYKKPAFWIILAAILCSIITGVCFLTEPKKEGEGTSHEEDLLAAIREKAQESDQNAEEGSWSVQERGAYKDLGESRRVELTDFVEEWTKAFVDRDGERLSSMMSQELREQAMADDDGYDFGFSSPWPRDAATDCFFDVYEEEVNRAEIRYYALTSDPHITCWRELLWLDWEDDRCVVTRDELYCYDDISTAKEFREAYTYQGSIDGTRMDYTKNGMGEILNENALLSSSMTYRDLFEPESAAIFLLNLSNDPEKVRYTLHEPEGDGLVGLDIHFLEDEETFTISMLQPYGENGIWVPVDYRTDVVARMRKIDREEWRKLRFSRIISDTSGILCIGEIPEQGIRLYGYNDGEVEGRGVALEAFGDMYYFDWYYTSPRLRLPELYWNAERRELQISCEIYTRGGVSAEEFHILRFDGGGMVLESRFGLEDYCALLEERIGWRFDEETRELVLTDKESGEALEAVIIPEEMEYNRQEESVTGLELGMWSGFDLGEKAGFYVYTGYYRDHRFHSYGMAEYEDMPWLAFELDMTRGENGDIALGLGRLITWSK